MNTLPIEIPCVILCGGKSSRMGEDKALLPFSNSNTLTSYQYDRLKPYFKNIYISSKVNKFDFLDESNLIKDEDKDVFSPLVALHTILKNINDEKVFILTVDTPFVKTKTMKTLFESSKSFDICIAQTQRTHNLCGVFSKSLLSNIEKMLAEDIHKIGFLIKNVKSNIVTFDDEDEFLNLNNKIEYEKAIELVKYNKN